MKSVNRIASNRIRHRKRTKSFGKDENLNFSPSKSNLVKGDLSDVRPRRKGLTDISNDILPENLSRSEFSIGSGMKTPKATQKSKFSTNEKSVFKSFKKRSFEDVEVSHGRIADDEEEKINENLSKGESFLPEIISPISNSEKSDEFNFSEEIDDLINNDLEEYSLNNLARNEASKITIQEPEKSNGKTFDEEDELTQKFLIESVEFPPPDPQSPDPAKTPVIDFDELFEEDKFLLENIDTEGNFSIDPILDPIFSNI
mmetsp:Transcript_3463/g.5381  ORF Transcript_3463/g.5381 Transcript_3463/m.5381 type:complete len:258 (-) Transcript_3463:81-854(-)